MDELKGIFFTKYGQYVELKIKDSKISNETKIKEKEQLRTKEFSTRKTIIWSAQLLMVRK